jgi:hypothetical protein
LRQAQAKLPQLKKELDEVAALLATGPVARARSAIERLEP